LWTVAHNRSWTTDRLVQHGLPHPSECPLCDQEDEDIQHLPIGCVSARQFWYSLLHRVGLSILTPQATKLSWEDWWMKAEAAVDGDRRKGLNTLIRLVHGPFGGIEMIVFSMEPPPDWTRRCSLQRKKPSYGVWQKRKASPSSLPGGSLRGCLFWSGRFF